MKIFSYLHYFFYVSFNWNFRIAITIINQEIKGEKKYTIDTTGADELKKLYKQGIDISHATMYMPISYLLLEEIFRQLSFATKKHFLDIGCGKGRAMCVAAYYGYKNITGIDFSKQFCENATNNLKHTQRKFPAINYHVTTVDAMNYEIPATVDCIFLFNPFDVVIMSAVVYNILESAKMYPREIIVAYANPLYEELFLEEGFTEIFHTKEMKYLEAAILKLPALI
ncbi:class I SAM-dependent methyltransferase [Ferruginibacter sp.]|uniref:class I SAM-dependent methyltransferase n=1 Tax=Ferruginibacter sp. TaxID=1940288 RepID=UPI0026587405|nr:class I SAM-dependent methyltransferase [Ferruginibacter sp.]